MCKICCRTPCHPSCPNSEPKPVYRCCECGEDIYEYEENVYRIGDDIYRRHDHCCCTVTFENGRTRQDSWFNARQDVSDDPEELEKEALERAKIHDELKHAEAEKLQEKNLMHKGLDNEKAKALEAKNLQYKGLTNAENEGIIGVEKEVGSEKMNVVEEKHAAAGNRRSPLYNLNDDEISYVRKEILAVKADPNDFVFNSSITKGTCFLASDNKVHIRGNIFPDEYSKHPRDKMSVRAVIAHEYYGHKPYREQYLKEDSDTSIDSISKIMSRAWADEFRASYMAAKNAPNLSDNDRYLLICDALSRAEEAGITIKYNDFIRRLLYG